MSKCDLGIEFDRPDRCYRAGETVSGTVHVQVNEDVDSRAVLLEQFWQTHGRGNTAAGPKRAEVLHEGPLRAGDVLSFPLRFIAADGPPTYHGRYLNVDHYVHVRVDVPWAIDPKLKEEYILLPGPRPYDNLPGPAKGAPRGKLFLGEIGVPLAIGLLVFGVIFIFPFGPFLIPAGLILLFFALRKKLAEKRLGPVKLDCGPTAVPGADLPVCLFFVPRKTCRVNSITAKLVGMERCVSGSGTNRTTHTHKLHQGHITLLSECDLAADSPVHLEASVPIPQTDAFTFHATDNEVAWELEVRVDVPVWPDWVEKRRVIVRPAVGPEAVEAIVLEQEPPAAGPLEMRPGVVAAVYDVGVEQAQHPDLGAAFDQPEATAGVPEPAAAEPSEGIEPVVRQPLPSEIATAGETAAGEPATAAALIEIVGRIATADRYSREREHIIEQNLEQTFACAVEITRAERTYTYIPDERFRQGRTVTGKLQGADCEVTVQLSAKRNGEIDALEPGSLIRADCKLLKWNTIYGRLEMREA